MGRAMARVQAVVARHRVAVVLAWILIVAAAVPLAARQSDHLTGGGFDVPGSASQRVEEMLVRGVPVDFRPATLAAVLDADAGPPVTRAEARAAVAALDRAARATPGVELSSQGRQIAVYLLAHRPGRAAVVPLTVSVDEFHAPDVAAELRRRLDLAGDGGRHGAVRLHLVGQGALWAGMLDVTKRDLAAGERLGFPIVALILLAVFGSLAAAALPVALAAAALAVTGAAIWWLSTVTVMSLFVTNMASMIGLGVAVDYSLFIVVRYREELRTGADPDRARAVAMRTSGVAVLFSGAAVVVAIASLLLIDVAAVRSLALGAIVVVLVSMLACATLLPALLALVGRRLRAGRAREPRAFARWADLVMRRPAASLIAATAILLALSAPTLALRTGDGALRQLPSGDETRAGFEAAIRETGPGRGAPVKILVGRGDVAAAVRLLLADPEVVKTGVRTQTRDHRRILIVATPRHDGDSAQAKALVARLRDRLPPGALVGGNSAAQVDFNAAVSGGLWRVLAWIVVLTFVLLMAMLRSAPLALQAVIANLLSVGAAFGVLTAVFVWGWLDGPLGFDSPGYVDTIAIPLVLAVVFGLSMDYEVFLLSRIRERHLATGDTRAAVREGLTSSARTITSAALVMVAVFGAFAITGVPVVKEVGLGSAVAIAVDATVVRLGLVPAGMVLLGRWCWWRPSLPARGTALVSKRRWP